ncbi:hypothetical protein [Dysosmobacter sp.]|uniref:hypothetical protein n=1 Tax=Dysosmobacter sp. TaxID=2591382 RepID=UPI003FD872DA
MEMTERTAPSLPVGPVRRVGTITFGLVLVVCGLAMLAAMFFPDLDLRWAIKLSPLALICLGAEVLLSARRGGRIRYDWVGMLLSGLIVGMSMCFFVAAWWALYAPEGWWYGCW